MKYQDRTKAVLLLSDGSFYEGYSIGKVGTTTGEICFNTGMTGYQEIYTDPSYYGQIMVNTHTHIGNYGVADAEMESDSVKIAGLIVRNFSYLHSRKLSDGSLQSYLEENNIVGISDLDTRQLVRDIRDKGAMNVVISSEVFEKEELRALLDQCPAMEGLELASKVTCAEPYFAGDPEAPFRVAALDLGIKRTILKSLAARGCYIKVFPAPTPFEAMAEFQPDGFFLSNGPGDPAAMPYAVETTRKLLDRDKPVFGICLGHQMICLALGLSTYKMHHGHRGINHPVLNRVTGRSEITSQNHGFVVSLEDAEKSDRVEVTHVHLNDNTLAGIKVVGKDAFSVQYHPEASPGPHDSRYLFDDFIGMMQAQRTVP
ncbi:MAG: glutamine-hydrolyzing carbamoyl-phosphate synthase small subunit, partial [Bacteroidota bacterium]